MIIGASSGLLVNSGASLIVGAFGGVVTSLGFSFMHNFLRDKLGIFDTVGVINLHGIPGILGGLVSGIVIAAYNSDPLNTEIQAK